MDWEEVDSLLKLHIQTKAKFESGLEDIRRLLNKDNNQMIVENFNFSRLKSEFFQFVEKTLGENPIPNNIRSICIGLFTMSDNGKEGTTLYLCGSITTPFEETLDWNVDPAYFPKYYFVPNDFEAINKSYPDMSGDQEVLVFNGIVNLLIINTIKEFEKYLLKKQNTIYLGAGFDSGDTYILGQLTKEGLK